eukprot:scaffold4189_cov86-Cylindrotheca_fusiformis.AAC.2
MMMIRRLRRFQLLLVILLQVFFSSYAWTVLSNYNVQQKIHQHQQRMRTTTTTSSSSVLEYRVISTNEEDYLHDFIDVEIVDHSSSYQRRRKNNSTQTTRPSTSTLFQQEIHIPLDKFLISSSSSSSSSFSAVRSNNMAMKWKKQIGDVIRKGDTILILEHTNVYGQKEHQEVQSDYDCRLISSSSTTTTTTTTTINNNQNDDIDDGSSIRIHNNKQHASEDIEIEMNNNVIVQVIVVPKKTPAIVLVVQPVTFWTIDIDTNTRMDVQLQIDRMEKQRMHKKIGQEAERMTIANEMSTFQEQALQKYQDAKWIRGLADWKVNSSKRKKKRLLNEEDKNKKKKNHKDDCHVLVLDLLQNGSAKEVNQNKIADDPTTTTTTLCMDGINGEDLSPIFEDEAKEDLSENNEHESTSPTIQTEHDTNLVVDKDDKKTTTIAPAVEITQEEVNDSSLTTTSIEEEEEIVPIKETAVSSAPDNNEDDKIPVLDFFSSVFQRSYDIYSNNKDSYY